MEGGLAAVQVRRFGPRAGFRGSGSRFQAYPAAPSQRAFSIFTAGNGRLGEFARLMVAMLRACGGCPFPGDRRAHHLGRGHFLRMNAEPNSARRRTGCAPCHGAPLKRLRQLRAAGQQRRRGSRFLPPGLCGVLGVLSAPAGCRCRWPWDSQQPRRWWPSATFPAATSTRPSAWPAPQPDAPPGRHLPVYVLAQLVGAAAGRRHPVGLFQGLPELSDTRQSSRPWPTATAMNYGLGFPLASALLTEVIAAALLTAVFLGATSGRRAAATAAFAVGVTYVVLLTVPDAHHRRFPEPRPFHGCRALRRVQCPGTALALLGRSAPGRPDRRA